MAEQQVEVQCYSGFTYAEEPRAFTWRGARYEITAIEKAWREPGRRCFLVRTRYHKSLRLCYNEKNQGWTLHEPEVTDNERDT